MSEREPPPAAWNEGPPCRSQGFDIVVTCGLEIPGKPPHKTVFLDFRIQNPRDQELWVFIGSPDLDWTALRSIYLYSESYARSPAFVWRIWLSDGRSGQAFRLAPRADVLVREVEYSVYPDSHALRFVLADALRVGGVPAPSWLGRPGLMPARGEFRVQYQTLVAERRLEGESTAPLDVDTLCVDTLDVNALPRP